MFALTRAIYARLAEDPWLTSSLGSFEAHPSIFTARPVPKTAENPLILASETIADDNMDWVNGQGREIVRDIAVYGKTARDTDAVEMIAERVRELFHRRALAVEGFHVVNVTARGPISAPADPDEIGRIITLTIRMDKR